MAIAGRSMHSQRAQRSGIIYLNSGEKVLEPGSRSGRCPEWELASGGLQGRVHTLVRLSQELQGSIQQRLLLF